MAIFFLRFVVFRFQESPKFLLYRGKDEKAVEVLQYIARYNKRECHVTLETFANLEDDSSSAHSNEPILGSGSKQLNATWQEKVKMEFTRYKYLFSSWTMGYFTVLVWVTYMWD